MQTEVQDPNLVIPQNDWTAWKQELKQSRGKRIPLWNVGTVARQRVRATASFYVCTGSDPTIPPGSVAPAADFDLALCSDTARRCWGISESLDDTNEGFDVIIPEQHTDLTLYLIVPSSGSTCYRSEGEPYAWAAVAFR